MKVELNIDPACPERKIVIYSDCMTDEIEALILKHAGANRIPGYTEDDIKMLKDI